MTHDVDAFLGGLTMRSLTREEVRFLKEAARERRSLPGEEKYQLVLKALTKHYPAGLLLARNLFLTGRQYEELVRAATKQADASRIQYWMKVLVPRVGMRRMITLLNKMIDEGAPEGAKALYWLPRVASPANSRWRPNFAALVLRAYEAQWIIATDMVDWARSATTQPSAKSGGTDFERQS